MPSRLRAASITAICMPKQMPKNGTLRSRANLTAWILPSVPRSPKPPGTRMPLHVLEMADGVVALEDLGVHPLQPDLHVAAEAAVRQRLAERLVGVEQHRVLADHRDRHLAFGLAHRAHHAAPAVESWARRSASRPK